MTVGLMAHDNKKQLMQNFCVAYRGILCKHKLVATETTGLLSEKAANLSILKLAPGHLGGVTQLANMIEDNSIDLMIFLSDPLSKKPSEPSLFNIMKLCDFHMIPLATNVATAELLICALNRGDLDWRL